MQVTLQYAQEHLSELLTVADSGQQVEIARPEKPPITLLLVDRAADELQSIGPRTLGARVGEPCSIEEMQQQLQEETVWIAANRAQYAGRWIALVGGNLLAVGDSAREVFQATAQTLPMPLIVRVDHEALPFAGW